MSSEEVTQTNFLLDTSTGEKAASLFWFRRERELDVRGPIILATRLYRIRRARILRVPRRDDGSVPSPQFQQTRQRATPTTPPSLVLITTSRCIPRIHTRSTPRPLLTMMSFAQVAKRSAGKTLRQHAIAKRCTFMSSQNKTCD